MTAPTHNDTVTFYGAGNSSDNQQSLTGDGIGTTTFNVQVTGRQARPQAFPRSPPATPAFRARWSAA
ncbi:MAG: hypothetical protein R2911_00035 [Caldilineaceae bacterium]